MDLVQVIYCIFSPCSLGNLDRFSADSDRVTDGLPDRSTDKSNDVSIEGIFPKYWTFRKFHPAILVGIFTMDLADGSTDRTDDGHTDGWMDF